MKQALHAKLHFIQNHSEKSIDENSINQSYKEWADKLFPKVEFMHHALKNDGRLQLKTGIIQVIFDGEVVGFFKSGTLRHQNDYFLHAFYQHVMDKILGIKKPSEPIFPTSFPLILDLNEVVFPATYNLNENEEDQILSLDGRENNQLYFMEKDISDENGGIQWLQGGMQPAFKAKFDGQIDDQSKTLITEEYKKNLDEKLIMMLFVLLLNIRDIKWDGVLGESMSTIVDCENFLEEKISNKNQSPLPSLFIPFHKEFSDIKPTKEQWERFSHYVDILSEKKEDLLDFIKDHIFSPQEIGNSFCSFEFERDNRKDNFSAFLDRKPNYENGGLLSVEQRKKFSDNLSRLKNAIEKIKEKEFDASIYDLIAKFDPIFARDETDHQILLDINLKTAQLEELDSELCKYAKQIQQTNSPPHQVTGLSQSPTPDLSNILGDITNTTNTTPHGGSALFAQSPKKIETQDNNHYEKQGSQLTSG